mmetsp:Transcript_2755/g.5237  ORF Transcript_2755/g.5237 Transcript_2755/m.5237 type:complete len:288 (-) Transcript_2755:96-959(-)
MKLPNIPPEKVLKFSDIPMPNHFECKALKLKRKKKEHLTELELAQIDVYDFMSIFVSNCDNVPNIEKETLEFLYDKYLQNRNKFKCVKYLKKAQLIRDYMKDNLGDTSKAGLSSHFIAKIGFLKELQNKLKIKHLNEVSKNLDVNDVKNAFKFVIEKETEIKDYLKVRCRANKKRNKNYGLFLTNSMFNDYSFCKIKKKRVQKRKNGKIVDAESKYQIEMNDKDFKTKKLSPSIIYDNIKVLKPGEHEHNIPQYYVHYAHPSLFDKDVWHNKNACSASIRNPMLEFL